MIQDVKSIFIAPIKQKKYFYNCNAYRDGSCKNIDDYKLRYDVDYELIPTGKSKLLYETYLSRFGLNIGEKFKINNTVVKIINKYVNPDESIVYTTDVIIKLEDENGKKEMEEFCAFNNELERNKFKTE